MTVTSLQILSDTHLELRKVLPKVTPKADHLALLGDIGSPFKANYENFLAQQARQYKSVFVVLGNHEYYSISHQQDMYSTKKRVKEICDRYENIHMLDKRAYNITDKTRLLGCTLWSLIDDHAVRFLNDFNKITVNRGGELRAFNIRDYLQLHEQESRWLHGEIQKCKEDNMNAVVLTHHGVHAECAGKFKGSLLNPGFVTELPFVLEKPVIAAASGHVHSNVDLIINGVRVLSNCLGYPSEKNVGFKEDVVIGIP